MNKKELLKLLEMDDNTQESNRVLIIDGLNLFFRSFARINFLNQNGAHVGGLGGFFRSLGSLIKYLNPTQVYIIFDGIGSSENRKNLIPEYKSNRNATTRFINKNVFDNEEESEDSQADQIIKIIQYLKTLPVKTIVLDGAEADDVIAYLSQKLSKKEQNYIIITSEDKDFLQLIKKNVIIYRPREKKLYDEDYFESIYDISPSNFIIYKTLIGDTSDKLKGVKGIGKGKIFTFFPELKTKKISLKDIFKISETKLKEHIIYARIINEEENIKKQYKIMDLKNPMISEIDKNYLDEVIKEKNPSFHPEKFKYFYEEDGLGDLVSNLDFWLQDVFKNLK